jgi:hypothetical protein
VIDENQPLTFRRALLTPEHWLLVVTTVTAMAGVTAWIVIPSP